MEIKDINLDDYEISSLEKEDVIVLRKKKIKYPRWGDLEKIKGVYIDSNSNYNNIIDRLPFECNKGIFLNKKCAKSALAMAQISQLIPYYGGEITDDEWEYTSIDKHVIFKEANRVKTAIFYSNYEFLAFHTAEQRDEFLKNNEQLVKDYLMIE